MANKNVPSFTSGGIPRLNKALTSDDLVPVFTIDGTWSNVPSDQVGSGLNLVNVKSYGAVGNGTTDDTRAIQRAINYAKSSGIGAVYFPTGRYLVTSSLNVTANSNVSAYRLIGEGKFLSIIEHRFPVSEAYPVVDMSGNGRGMIQDLTVRPSGTSYATCALLFAKGASGGSNGNTQTAMRCYLQAGRVVGDCAAVAYNTDLSRFVDCEIWGGAGALAMGLAKPANVTSKYVTIPTSPDWTQGYVTRCELVGSLAPGFEFTGGTAISIIDTYIAITGAGNPYIMRVSAPDDNSGNTVIAHGLRTENQSTAVGVTSIQFDRGSRSGFIVGALNSSLSGYCIGSAAGKGLDSYILNVSGISGFLFNMLGAMSNIEVMAQVFTNRLGNVVAAASYNLSFTGILRTDILAAFPAVVGLKSVQSNFVAESAVKAIFTPGDTSLFGRQRLLFEDLDVNSTAYTGGSGEVSIFTRTVKVGVMEEWQAGQLPQTGMEILMAGRVNATSAAAGRIRLQLTQGANSVTLADWNNGPPAGATPGGGLSIEIELLRTGTNQLRPYVKIFWCGSVFVSPVNFLGANFTVDGSDMTLDVFVTNTGNTPINIFRWRAVV